MKHLFFLAMIFFGTSVFTQNVKVPDFKTIDATYIGSTNAIFYFKDTDTGNMLAFKTCSKEAKERLESNNDYVGENLLITYKITYVERKREATTNDTLDVISSTYKKVLSLENIQENIED